MKILLTDTTLLFSTKQNREYQISKNSVIISFYSILFGLLGFACKTESLSPLTQANLPSGYVNVNAEFCTSPPKVVQQKLKYIFIVDQSSYNQLTLSPPLPGGQPSAGITINISGSGVMTVGDLYLITSLGTSTQADWVAMGYPSTIQAQVGSAFIASVTGGGVGTGTVTPLNSPGQDPTGTLRFAPIVTFINNLLSNTPATGTVSDPIYLTLIPFNNAAAVAFPLNYGFVGLHDTFASTNQFLYALRTAWTGSGSYTNPAPNDSGLANYQSAINQAISVIQNDVQNESQSQQSPIITSIYQVIVIAGSPPSSVVDASTIQYIVNLNGTGIISNNLLPYVSGIFLNSIYYLPAPTPQYPTPISYPDAIAQLKIIASAGNGQFNQIDSTQIVNYQTLVPPTPQLKYILSDVFLESVNTVWWDNGLIQRTSAGDGLPDQIKQSFHGNISLSDFDGNGVNDLVEYRTKGVPFSTPSDPYFICTGFSNSSGGSKFTSSANDGLNDCEKYVLGDFNPNFFNIPGSFVPIEYGFKNNLSIAAQNTGTNGAGETLADPFGDQLTNYQKLKLGLPTSISKTKLQTFTTRDMTITHLSPDGSGLECYQMNINNVAVVGDTNTFKMYVIENTAIIQDNPILKVAERTVSGTSTPIVFNPEDFQ